MASTPVMRATAEIARASRAGDEEAAARARRKLAVAKIEHFIHETLATSPPLSDEQLKYLAALLSTVRKHGEDGES